MFTLKQTPDEQITILRDWAQGLDVGLVADHVLLNEQFKEWSGSTDKKHHSRQHGLLEHTYEVAMICKKNMMFYYGQINIQVLFLSAIYHDFGKLWDYEKVIVPPTYWYEKEEIGWVKAPHNRKVHHVSRSAIEWSKVADKFNIDLKTHDEVLHCILSHHGLREWGSPVFPKTKEAWLLHLSDQMSARMDDCGRIDLV
jgi:3'-5' exoribonuclease